MTRRIDTGSPEPLGVTPRRDGVNVAVFSAHADSIELCLFDAAGIRETDRIALPERTGDVFHAFIGEVVRGTRYGFRAHGPFDPAGGHRFNPSKLLIDPYAHAVDRRITLHPSMYGGEVAPDDRDSAEYVAKGIVVGSRTAATSRVAVPWSDTIIYELHVRGFTRTHPQIAETVRGTCAAVAHPAAITHLARLGVSTVELMPLAAAVEERHLAALSLSNYWRYNPIAWLAPDPWLAPGGMEEVAACVAALHGAGIEVIQDMVLNHSGEGDRLGPTLSLRGLDNASYYRMSGDGQRNYVDDTGCGNSLALNRPPALRLALDALRHFAQRAGVDGFRFDLGTALGRNGNGFDPAAPLLLAIAQDPLLRRLKIIVEPWDVGSGGYRLGEFPASWGEWNDRCRDTIRRFWGGDGCALGELATRISGSSDIFRPKRRPPSRSINFVSAHDGFTLADLVSYEAKHNEANGEGNNDGTDNNLSWNHGIEGPTNDAAICEARKRDVRNMLATVMLARGTPMLSMGDELGRSQQGNNNAYAQDSALTWIDWGQADQGLIDFVASLCSLRRAHPGLREDRWLTGAPVDETGIADVEWRRADGRPMTSADWTRADAQLLVAALHAKASGTTPADRVVVVLNAGAASVNVNLPPLQAGFGWSKAIDTSGEQSSALPPLVYDAMLVAARSVVVLTEERMPAGTRHRAAESDAFAELARAAGILPAWKDVNGTQHVVTPDTQRALLAAMGLGANSEADARERLRDLSKMRWRGILPVTAVARRGAGIEIPIALSESALRRRHRLLIDLESGEERQLEVDAATLAAVTPVPGTRRKGVRCTLRLPALPQGVHRLRTEEDHQQRCTVIVAPAHCHVPDALSRGDRSFGLSAALYALRRERDLGVGDFATLAAVARATARVGGSIVGINPLHALFTHDRDRASPYHPSDRRYLDPLYIDVKAVSDFDESREAHAVLAANERVLAEERAAAMIDYVSTWRVKRAVLDACFVTFERRAKDDRLVIEFEAFVRAGGESLAAFALFDAIGAAYPRMPWMQWPRGLRRPGTAAANAFARQHGRDVRFAMYMQWQAERQLREVQTEARNAGLPFGLYRDLAIGAAPDGAEAWANFKGLAHAVSAGAPPDTFSPSGQVWDLPPAIPHAMGASGYAGFRELLAANMRHAGALRVDHVMGLARLFWVPRGATAREGAYVSYPFDDLLAVLALESERARCLVVGEDLGTVPDGLRERLAAESILSYRVLWFERDGAAYNAPERYPTKAVACVSTHDLPTIRGWWSGADITEKRDLGMLPREQADAELAARAVDRDLLAQALNRERSEQQPAIDANSAPDAKIAGAIHRHLARSPAALMLVQADDLADELVAQNLPATDRERPNWRRKVSVDASALWNTDAGQATLDACAERGARQGAP